LKDKLIADFFLGVGVFFVAKKVTRRRGGMRERRGGGIKLEIALTSRTISKGKFIADSFFAVFPPRRKADPVRGNKSLNTKLHKYKPLKSNSQILCFSLKFGAENSASFPGGGVLKFE